MNLDYVVDVGIKGILATILAGVLLNVILKGYDKLKNDRDSDVFEEATTLFINSLLIYYRKFSKKYYDKQIKGCFYEIIYIHKHPIKRFVKAVPKLWVVSVFTIPVMYIILIILLGVLGNGLLLIWIIMIGLILLYVTNFLIFVRLSAYISKQNKTDQYIGYYKTNNLA